MDGSTTIPARGSPPEAEVTCAFCEDTFPVASTFKSTCGHTICGRCLQKHFQGCLQETKFPAKCCDIAIPEEAYKLVTQDLANKLRRKKNEYSVPVEQRVFCRACAGIILPSKIDQVAKKGICEECEAVNCLKCHELDHQGWCIKPGLDKGTVELRKMLEREGWMTCYRCKQAIEKTIACDHMSCPCGAQFCYLCGAEWKTCDCYHADFLPDADQNANFNRRQMEIYEAYREAERQRQEEMEVRHRAEMERLEELEQQRRERDPQEVNRTGSRPDDPHWFRFIPARDRRNYRRAQRPGKEEQEEQEELEEQEEQEDGRPSRVGRDWHTERGDISRRPGETNEQLFQRRREERRHRRRSRPQPERPTRTNLAAANIPEAPNRPPTTNVNPQQAAEFIRQVEQAFVTNAPRPEPPQYPQTRNWLCRHQERHWVRLPGRNCADCKTELQHGILECNHCGIRMCTRCMNRYSEQQDHWGRMEGVNERLKQTNAHRRERQEETWARKERRLAKKLKYGKNNQEKK